MGMSEALELDPNLLPWALIPIVVITCAVSYGRLLLNVLMKKDTSKADVKDLIHKQTLQRAARLRGNGRYLTSTAISNREKFFLAPDGGALIAGDIPPPDPADAMKNLGNMNMGGQMAIMFSTMIVSQFVTWCFPGFVLLKLPFPVTEKFRPLLQNGLLPMPTLDVTYITSLSWYFLTMFGMQPFVMLLASKLNQAQFSDIMLQQQMGMGAQKQPQQFDAKKLLDNESKMFEAFVKYATDMTAARAASEKIAGISSS